MVSIYSQLDQHQLLFTQLAIQLVVWYYAFNYAEWYIRTHCTTHKVCFGSSIVHWVFICI